MPAVVPNSPYEMVAAMVGLIYYLEVALERDTFPDGDWWLVKNQVDTAKRTIAWAEPVYYSPKG